MTSVLVEVADHPLVHFHPHRALQLHCGICWGGSAEGQGWQAGGQGGQAGGQGAGGRADRRAEGQVGGQRGRAGRQGGQYVSKGQVSPACLVTA